MNSVRLISLMLVIFGSAPRVLASTTADHPRVTPPPESFFGIVAERNREVAREFYKKYIDVKGMPVVAAGEVADLALQRTYDIVTHMLAGRPDVLKAMVSNGMYLIIIGKNQVYTDMPEYRNDPNPAYQNERVRGTGGKPTSFGEENLLSLPIDRYDDESIGVHEFCHTIDGALRSMDPEWRQRKETAFKNALSKGLWRYAYAGSNAGEYWAEICQSYFDCNRINNWNHGPIGTREQLRLYDPEGYELVRNTFNLTPDQDWRYSFLQKLPNVSPAPAHFKIDPFYTKFTWAREFTVVGREASDQALLKANDTIRKMFTYRHDILKALIGNGAKLVVLGRHERLADLPELKRATETSSKIDLLGRTLEYTPEVKLLVAGEERIDHVVGLFARALYRVTAKRPVDPNWENRGRAVQQYELRVKRLDVRFDEALARAYEDAISAGKWKGTSAVHDRIGYWASGVLAYFDVPSEDAAPADASHPVQTREALQQYDPDLFALVEETMAYTGHRDWRFSL